MLTNDAGYHGCVESHIEEEKYHNRSMDHSVMMCVEDGKQWKSYDLHDAEKHKHLVFPIRNDSFECHIDDSHVLLYRVVHYSRT